MLVTGFLVNTSPSHSHDHGPQEVRAESQGLTVEGTIVPGVVGANTLVLDMAIDGGPVTSDEVDVSFRMPEQDIGPIVAEVEQLADGSWAATVNLPVAGVWDTQVGVRVSKFERPIVVVPVSIG